MSAPAGFEGSFLGDVARLAADARLECGVCWHVYDPEIGDPVWQIPPGTPFSALPEHWRCPHCDAPRDRFMVAGHGRGASESPTDPVAQLVAAYREAATRMRTLPVYNPQLTVEAVGFRPWEGGQVGVLVTPWSMVLVHLPVAGTNLTQGSKRTLVFPSGRYEFTAGIVDGIGVHEMCSLFSPMAEFPDLPVARMTAQAAADGLFAPADADDVETPGPALHPPAGS